MSTASERSESRFYRDGVVENNPSPDASFAESTLSNAAGLLSMP
jgi:hypothetical protein